MSQPLLVVVAEAQAKAGQEDALRAAFLRCIDPTRAESGCVQYDLHEDTEKPGHFIMFERWTSRQALDEHLKTPHLTEFLGLLPSLLECPIRIVTLDKLA